MKKQKQPKIMPIIWQIRRLGSIQGSSDKKTTLRKSYESLHIKLSKSCFLFLDGDERIPTELQQEIIAELNKSDKKEAYYFYRKFYFAGKPIHFSGTQNDKNFRLFRRSKCRYVADKKVHETLIVKGTTGILKNKLLHYSFDNFEQFKKKMLYYGLLKGSELADKGKKYSIITHWSKVAFKFVKTYFLKLGFLDGFDGLKISYLQSLYVNETYRKLKNSK